MVDPTNPAELVRLPSMGVDEAVTVARKLVKAARKRALPRRLRAHAERLEQRLASLEKARQRLSPDGSDANRRVALDRDLDLLLSVLDGVLAEWSRLPAARFPQSVVAQSLRRAMFPEGLAAVTQVSMDVEHTRVDRGLARVERSPYGSKIPTLALSSLFDAIRAVLPDYAAVALDAPSRATSGTQPVSRKEYLALLEAMRAWVLQVSAHVDVDNVNTVKRARRLLAPIERARRVSPRKAPVAPPPQRPSSAPMPV
jgi:hypothetical protein